MFGNETESCMLDLVKVKVRLGKHKIPITLLVHDSAAMGYFNCPGLFDVAQRLESKGFHLADHDITSDALSGIEILIGVNHFTKLIVRQKRSQGTSLFVTKGGRVIPFSPLPRWATSTSKKSTSQIRCARISLKLYCLERLAHHTCYRTLYTHTCPKMRRVIAF